METAVADDMVGNLPVDKEALTVSIKGKNVKDLFPLATTVLLGQFYRFLAKISFCPFYTLSDTQVEDDDDEEEKSKVLNDLRKDWRFEIIENQHFGYIFFGLISVLETIEWICAIAAGILLLLIIIIAYRKCREQSKSQKQHDEEKQVCINIC